MSPACNPLPTRGAGFAFFGISGNTIGGTTSAERNVISGNQGSGISLDLPTPSFSTSDSNVILGNYIGVAADGQTTLGNSGNGITINSGNFNQIGGTNSGEANVIAHNGLYGVQVDIGVGNSILSNSIFGNGSGGIILTNGGNNDQVAPVLTQALAFADRTEITGTLAVTANTGYLVQFFANDPASGQGQTLIGSQTVAARPTNTTVNLALTGPALPAGATVTAIASVTSIPGSSLTEAVGDTSAFSLAAFLVNPFIVTNTGDFGLGSLRFAIQSANTDVNNNDTITFQIPTDDGGYSPATLSWTILVQSNLVINKLPSQTVQNSVVIDGLSQQTQPGATTAHPVIVLAPGSEFTGNGLIISSSGNTVRGLVISGFGNNGILVNSGASGNLIANNYLGTNVLGTAGLGNADAGVRLGGPSNTLTNNVISGNTDEGVFVIGAGNTLLNNLIGTNAAGTASVGNGLAGITVQVTSGTTIRGNTISGNGVNPILASGIFLTTGSRNNLIEGNRVGTSADGTQAIPNSADGIDVNDSNNTIGGTSAGAGNLISGNSFQGMVISGPGGNQVLNNRIGTNAAGTAILGNGFNGLELRNSPNNLLIGNLISGNGSTRGGGTGIRVTGSSSQGNIIQGNLVGTDAAGTGALPNLNDGIALLSSANTVGGTAAAARNVISGNGGHGLTISGAAGNSVINNFIGVAIGGKTALGNMLDGIFLNNASGNLISGNVLSGNGVGQDAAGINITGSDSAGNLMVNNLIGTNDLGTAALGNSLHGIFIGGGASNNTVGSGNIISGQRRSGQPGSWRLRVRHDDDGQPDHRQPDWHGSLRDNSPGELGHRCAAVRGAGQHGAGECHLGQSVRRGRDRSRDGLWQPGARQRDRDQRERARRPSPTGSTACS